MQPKFGGYLQHFTAQDVAYFRDMPFSLSIPSHGVLVAHAGIVPEKPLEQQLLIDMLNVRACSQIGASAAADLSQHALPSPQLHSVAPVVFSGFPQTAYVESMLCGECCSACCGLCLCASRAPVNKHAVRGEQLHDLLIKVLCCAAEAC